MLTKSGKSYSSFFALYHTHRRACCAACIFSIPQHLLLHEGRAWSDPHYGTAFTRLKVPSPQYLQCTAISQCETGQHIYMLHVQLSLSVCMYRRGAYIVIHQMQEAVGDALDRRWALCLLLLVEKARGKGSFWAAYIAALPTSYSMSLAAP